MLAGASALIGEKLRREEPRPIMMIFPSSGLDIKPLSNMTSPDIGASPQVVGGVAPPATAHQGGDAGQTSAGQQGPGAPLELRCTVEDGKSAFPLALAPLLGTPASGGAPSSSGGATATAGTAAPPSAAAGAATAGTSSAGGLPLPTPGDNGLCAGLRTAPHKTLASTNGVGVVAPASAPAATGEAGPNEEAHSTQMLPPSLGGAGGPGPSFPTTGTTATTSNCHRNLKKRQPKMPTTVRDEYGRVVAVLRDSGAGGKAGKGKKGKGSKSGGEFFGKGEKGKGGKFGGKGPGFGAAESTGSSYTNAPYGGVLGNGAAPLGGGASPPPHGHSGTSSALFPHGSYYGGTSGHQHYGGTSGHQTGPPASGGGPYYGSSAAGGGQSVVEASPPPVMPHYRGEPTTVSPYSSLDPPTTNSSGAGYHQPHHAGGAPLDQYCSPYAASSPYDRSYDYYASAYSAGVGTYCSTTAGYGGAGVGDTAAYNWGAGAPPPLAGGPPAAGSSAPSGRASPPETAALYEA